MATKKRNAPPKKKTVVRVPLLCEKHEKLLRERGAAHSFASGKARLALMFRRNEKVKASADTSALLPMCCHLGDAAVNAVIQGRPVKVEGPKLSQLSARELADVKKKSEKAKSD